MGKPARGPNAVGSARAKARIHGLLVSEGSMTRGEEARLEEAMRPFGDDEEAFAAEQDRRDAEDIARQMAREQEMAEERMAAVI